MKHSIIICAVMASALGFIACSQQASSESENKFVAEAAWDEFKSTFDLFYAYRDNMDFDVDVAMNATRARAHAAKDAESFRRALSEFSYLFADPHIIIGPLASTDYNVVPTSADLRIGFENGRYQVIDVRAGAASDKAGIRPGDVLEAVEGRNINIAVQALFEGYVTSPTARQKSHVATLLANGIRTGDRTLTFSSRPTVSLSNTREYAKAINARPPLSISYLDDVAVIRFHNSLGNNETIKAFDAAMSKTSQASGLILDFRETPSGGNTEVARSIIGHFIKDARAYQMHRIPSLEREFTVPRQFVEYVLPRAPYRDPITVVALGSYWTGSMGEGVIIGLDGAANMHIIASDMAGLLGGLSNYNLQESGLRIDLPSESLFHINGVPRENYIADTVLRSAERDENGDDPAIRAALSFFAN